MFTLYKNVRTLCLNFYIWGGCFNLESDGGGVCGKRMSEIDVNGRVEERCFYEWIRA